MILNSDPQFNLNLNAYKVDMQQSGSVSPQLVEQGKNSSPLWSKPHKRIVKIGGVVNAESFMDTGSGINLAGPKFAEKFGVTEPGQTSRG